MNDIISDSEIIELLFQRNEIALEKMSKKYSRMYKDIIRKTLCDESDVNECANDVLLSVWNSIPPNRPEHLPSYICKLARRVGINRYKHNTCQKRSGEYTFMLSELEECIPDLDEVNYLSSKNNDDLYRILSDFVKNLDKCTQVLFIRRYIFFESVTSLADRFDINVNAVSVRLHRARKKLKKILEKEGIDI